MYRRVVSPATDARVHDRQTQRACFRPSDSAPSCLVLANHECHRGSENERRLLGGRNLRRATAREPWHRTCKTCPMIGIMTIANVCHAERAASGGAVAESCARCCDTNRRVSRPVRCPAAVAPRSFGPAENNVLPVVESPVAGQDAPFSIELPIELRSGKRRYDCKPRQIDAAIDSKSGCSFKDVEGIVVQTKYEAGLQSNSATM